MPAVWGGLPLAQTGRDDDRQNCAVVSGKASLQADAMRVFQV